ncbi:MAG: hypothetical protein GY794_13990, partial [bacterium]|nr:hypothetical protein [bacterium]
KTDLFNSQVLLWPGEAESPWLGKFEGARDEVLSRRRKAIHNVFGPDIETAGEVIDRMLYTDFALASELRMRYDVEYCTGVLGYSAPSDLRTGCREPRDLKRAERMSKQAGKGQIALKRFLSDHRSQLLESKNAGPLRAVTIAFHIDKNGLKRKIIDHTIHRRTSVPVDEILTLIDTTATEARAYTRHLVAVRMHHELTRLARSGYYKLLTELAY